MDDYYNECFGFTGVETKTLLEYYDLELNDDVKNMHDSYNFSGVEIYNPWSILNYAFDKKLEPFWINTSGNELIINSIKNCSENIKVVIEKLLTGDSVEFIYNDKVTYLDYNNLNSINNILNLLFINGYLTIDKKVVNDFGDDKIDLKEKIEVLKETSGKKFFDKDKQEVFPEKDFYLSTEVNKYNFVLKVEKDINNKMDYIVKIDV